jgi:hypothetical protein
VKATNNQRGSLHYLKDALRGARLTVYPPE